MKDKKQSTQSKPVEGKRVLCYGCNNPIHISHFAGVAMTEQGEAFFCDSLPCLLVLADLTEEKPNAKN